MRPDEIAHLRRCIALAGEALDRGGDPFGSILVSAEGRILREERNETGTGDATRHPEFALARWAIEHLSVEERRAATVYTSGEHCPMCSAAHAWAGLGPIVYASSSAQLAGWLEEFGAGPLPVRPLAIGEVAPAIPVSGPVRELAPDIRALHARRHRVG